MADYTQTIKGTVSKNASDGSSNGWEFYMDVSYTQDLENASSTFTVHQYLKSKYRSYGGGYDYKNTIGSLNTGTKHATTSTVGSTGTNWVTVDIVPVYTKTIAHQENGQISASGNTITLSAYFLAEDTQYSPGACNASVTLTIPQISTEWATYEVYIDNGTSWDKYEAYIDNGTSWDKYTIHVGQES